MTHKNHCQMEGKIHTIYWGWVMVALAFVNLAVVFGVWYSFSVFSLALVQEFHWSRAVVSSVFSIFIVCQSLVGPLAGRLMDVVGPRVTIPLGATIMAAALVVVSQADGLNYLRLAYGVLAGAGAGLVGFSAHSAWLPRWFERQRGLAMGIVTSGIGVGILVVVPTAEFFISHYGWRAAYLALAAMLLGLLVPTNLLFARRSPAEMGLQVDGGEGGSSTGRGTRPAMEIIDQAWAGRNWTLKKAAGTRSFWFMMAAVGFGSFCYQGVFLHAVASMVNSGVDRARAAFILGIAGIVGAMGKIGFGFVSDRLGREVAITIATVFASLGLFCLISVSGDAAWLPLLFAVLFGLGYGAAAPLFPSVVADLFIGRSFGVIVAVVFLGAGAGGSLGPVVMGLLRDVLGDYHISFVLAMAMLLVSCLLIWLTAPRKVRRVIRAGSSATTT